MEEVNKRIRKILDEKGRCIVSIDGRCASGKSTFGKKLADFWQGALIHMDDFFMRMEQRTPERYATPGENVDHERFLSEVLEPLVKGIPFSYIPFDCNVMRLSDTPIEVPQRAVTVIEGSYSQRPDLRKYYDLNVAIDIDPIMQRERLLKRNPEKIEMFEQKWIPLEEMYFKTYRIYEKADIVLKADNGSDSL